MRYIAEILHRQPYFDEIRVYVRNVDDLVNTVRVAPAEHSLIWHESHETFSPLDVE